MERLAKWLWIATVVALIVVAGVMTALANYGQARECRSNEGIPVSTVDWQFACIPVQP